MFVNDAGAASLAKFGLIIPPNVDINGRLRFEKNVRVYAAGTVLNKCDIGAYSYVVSGTLRSVAIGRFCSIGHAVEIGFHNHPVDWVSSHPFTFMEYMPDSLQWPVPLSFDYEGKPVSIGSDVWVGAHAIIMGGLTVGHGAIVASGSVVTRDVEPYAIVGGNPAKVIRKRFDDAVVDALLELHWWDYDWPEAFKSGAMDIPWDRPEEAIAMMKAKIASREMDRYLMKEVFNVIE